MLEKVRKMIVGSVLTLGLLLPFSVYASTLDVPTPINVVFSDQALAGAIADELGMLVTDEITQIDLDAIIDFHANNATISNLEGMQYLRNLEELFLNNNSIMDLTPIGNLEHLWHLSMPGNMIIDLSPLSNSYSLVSVWLVNNNIVDISPFANLTNLETLGIAENFIVDISSLADLTNLMSLHIASNRIEDISVLRYLTSVRSLDISHNYICDVTPAEEMLELFDMFWVRNFGQTCQEETITTEPPVTTTPTPPSNNVTYNPQTSVPNIATNTAVAVGSLFALLFINRKKKTVA